MGKCFSIEKKTPNIKNIRTKLPQIIDYSDDSVCYEIGVSPKLSTRAYEIIDKEVLHLYKISISSVTSKDSKDPSVHRGESYQNLRKTYFVDTRY